MNNVKETRAVERDEKIDKDGTVCRKRESALK